MRLLLNIIWLVLAGVWAFIAWAFAALVLAIITIPFAVQAAKIAIFSLWPFGRTLVRSRNSIRGLSVAGNVLWLIVFGWWLALVHLITGILLCLTIIGIPLGLGNFKLIPVSLWPFGREIVSLDEARARGLDPDIRVAE
jgi:uncharacterized membrane protein YccF (DUF307 family)